MLGKTFVVLICVGFVTSSLTDDVSDNGGSESVDEIMASLSALGDNQKTVRAEEDNLERLSRVNKANNVKSDIEDSDLTDNTFIAREARGYNDYQQPRKGQQWRGKSKTYRGRDRGKQGYHMMSDGVGMDYAEYQTEKLHSDLLKMYEKVLDELMERDKLKDKISRVAVSL